METDCRQISTASVKNQRDWWRGTPEWLRLVSEQLEDKSINRSYADGATIFMGTQHYGYINFC